MKKINKAHTHTHTHVHKSQCTQLRFIAPGTSLKFRVHWKGK